MQVKGLECATFDANQRPLYVVSTSYCHGLPTHDRHPSLQYCTPPHPSKFYQWKMEFDKYQLPVSLLPS
jgi:hypothetical protein